MATRPKTLTVEEFDALILQAEYADQDWEYIAGEMVEVSSNQLASMLAGNVLFLIKLFMREAKIRGIVTTTDGGYRIAGQRYIPDVAYISEERQKHPNTDGYSPIIPEFVVEVISDPNNTKELNELRVKTTDYLSEGIWVWVVHPADKTVDVHRPGQATQRVGIDGSVTHADEADVLPGLTIAVRDIFEGTQQDES